MHLVLISVAKKLKRQKERRKALNKVFPFLIRLSTQQEKLFIN